MISENKVQINMDMICFSKRKIYYCNLPAQRRPPHI